MEIAEASLLVHHQTPIELHFNYVCGSGKNWLISDDGLLDGCH
jgi:hypothetical protein